MTIPYFSFELSDLLKFDIMKMGGEIKITGSEVEEVSKFMNVLIELSVCVYGKTN